MLMIFAWMIDVQALHVFLLMFIRLGWGFVSQ
jgi:hypothetical protein